MRQLKATIGLGTFEKEALRGIEWVIFGLKTRERWGLEGDSAFLWTRDLPLILYGKNIETSSATLGHVFI
jgi:hypothetical protein